MERPLSAYPRLSTALPALAQASTEHKLAVDALCQHIRGALLTVQSEIEARPVSIAAVVAGIEQVEQLAGQLCDALRALGSPGSPWLAATSS